MYSIRYCIHQKTKTLQNAVREGLILRGYEHVLSKEQTEPYIRNGEGASEEKNVQDPERTDRFTAMSEGRASGMEPSP